MSSMNAIAVEAYKKYILVSLIHLRQVCVSHTYKYELQIYVEY